MVMESGVRVKETTSTSTKAHTKMIKSMVMVILYGLVETNLREAIWTTNAKERDKWNGLTVLYM